MADTSSTAASAKRGRFIVIEGLDRAGKSTQVDRLAKRLDAKVWKFPGVR
jgi:dTMP kinase